jgi:hypothetical protein
MAASVPPKTLFRKTVKPLVKKGLEAAFVPVLTYFEIKMPEITCKMASF